MIQSQLDSNSQPMAGGQEDPAEQFRSSPDCSLPILRWSCWSRIVRAQERRATQAPQSLLVSNYGLADQRYKT